MLENLAISIVLAPLFATIVAGIVAPNVFSATTARKIAHTVTIGSVFWSFAASLYLALQIWDSGISINYQWFDWISIGSTTIGIGLLLDSLSLLMMLVVTFVSLMVHIYTIGYMSDDSGYCRFFAYISLFTFAMLMLVMANNFLQLFFGWEAVGLVSYLLIGFWYEKPSAIYANLKAFLVNRVGDLGFLIGIGLVLYHFGSLDYQEVFAQQNSLQDTQLVFLGFDWDIATLIGLFLFIGAMGKSAQIPLHVWLPDSMEGPTPISALIHAATMVTAGIFMVSRMSPLFEYSDSILNFIMLIGGLTALLMGLLGLVQNDIKRVVAYSTLSQLGYMTAALGASAYSVAIFHLTTHAFFKALLFLGAGSVIVALHHQQDMTKMGGLRHKLPITYWTMLLASLALCGIPPLAGFYSKDFIVEAVGYSNLPVASMVYIMLVVSSFVTAFYSLRLLYLTFHGQTRMSAEDFSHVKEPRWVITLPLILLAVPSVLSGYLLIEPLAFSDYFAQALFVLPEHANVAKLTELVEGEVFSFTIHGLASWVLWLALAGIAVAVFIYKRQPVLLQKITYRLPFVHKALVNKYWFDKFNDWFFAGGIKHLGTMCWQLLDRWLIDRVIVGGSANLVKALAIKVRRLQTGLIYHYAFSMFVAVCLGYLWLFYS